MLPSQLQRADFYPIHIRITGARKMRRRARHAGDEAYPRAASSDARNGGFVAEACNQPAAGRRPDQLDGRE